MIRLSYTLAGIGAYWLARTAYEERKAQRIQETLKTHENQSIIAINSTQTKNQDYEVTSATSSSHDSSSAFPVFLSPSASAYEKWAKRDADLGMGARMQMNPEQSYEDRLAYFEALTLEKNNRDKN
jgi:hypothetical protein